MRTKTHLVVFTIILLFSGTLRAEVNADVQRLKDEALEILKANASRKATPEQYAQCIFKLETAMNLLESTGNTDNALSQEVSVSLFWARKFADMHVLTALDQLKRAAGTPLPVSKNTDVPKLPDKSPDIASDPMAGVAEAQKAFQIAEEYAAAHSEDDYAIAMHWFQMANQHSGTDLAYKALGLARAAQTRFAAKTAVPEDHPETTEGKLIKEGDAALAKCNFEEALALYKSSLTIKDTQLGHQKLAHANYLRARQLKDELLPKFEANLKAYNAAFKKAAVKRTVGSGFGKMTYYETNWNFPPLVDALKKHADLVKQTDVAFKYYNQAESEFNQVLRMAPEHKDLDAAGHIGLCLSVRGDNSYRSRARQHIRQFLSDYTPGNDIERSLYEFCKTELVRIK